MYVTRTEPPHPERHLRAHLAQFMGELFQAVLRAGKYVHLPPDDPSGKVADLHGLFRGLMQDREELWLYREAPQGHGLVVAGVLPEPTPVQDLLKSGLGARLSSELAGLLAARRLVSVTLGAGLELEELDAFLESLGPLLAPRLGSEGLPPGAPSLNGLPNVSVLGVDHLVNPGQPLSWPARLVLSRLRQDLPVQRTQSLEPDGPRGDALAPPGPQGPTEGGRTLAEVSCRLLRRAVQNLRQPALLAELLRGAELLPRAGPPGARHAVERAIIAALPPPLLGPVLAELSRAAAAPAPGGGPRPPTDDPRLKQILGLLAEATLAAGAPGGEEGLAVFFRSRAVSLADLLEPLQDYIVVRHLARGLSEEASGTLVRLHRDPKGYAPLLGPVMAELTRRGHYEQAAAVLGLALDLPAAATRLQDVIEREKIVPLLLGKLEESGRDPSARIADLLALIGPRAVEPIIEFIARSAHRGARRTACEILGRIGAPALPALVAHLDRPEHPWYVVRNLLHVLGTIGQPAPTKLARYLRHGHPRVREEAVSALARIHGREMEGELVNALEDPNSRTRGRAIMALADLESTHPGFLRFLVDAIRRKTSAEPEEDEEIQILACAALQRLGRIPWPADPPIEVTLREALEAGPKHPLMAVLKGGYRPKRPAVRAALAETLAALGAAALSRT